MTARPGNGTRNLIVLTIAVGSATLAACASDQRPSLQPPTSTPPTTAIPSREEVKAGIRRGLASIRTLRAEVVGRHHGTERRRTLEMTSEGVMRVTGDDLASAGGYHSAGVYDAARGIAYDDRRGGTVVMSGLPPGRPSPSAPWPLRPGLGITFDPVLAARHVLDWSEFGVTTTNVDGRPAWLVQWSAPRGLNPDLLTVAIDVRTGVALRAEWFFENQPVYEMQVAALQIDSDLAIPPPSDDGSSARPGSGYRRTTIEDAARLAGYQPAVPAWLPSGFVPAEVAFAVQTRGSSGFLHRDPSFVHPDSTHIVSAAYRRGLDELVITTRLRGSRPWTNPYRPNLPPPPPGEQVELPEGPIQFFRWEPATVPGGAFAGAQGERSVIAPYGVSIFWALNDELSLLAQGDVTVEEMQRIVESLRRL